MKTKEISKQVRDKVVEKYRSGLGYKKISETLNIPQSNIKSIFFFKLRIWHHNKPAKRGLPTKTHGPVKEGIIIREATKRPKITPKEQQSSTVEIGVSTLATHSPHYNHFKPYTPQSWPLRKKAIA